VGSFGALDRVEVIAVPPLRIQVQRMVYKGLTEIAWSEADIEIKARRSGIGLHGDAGQSAAGFAKQLFAWQ
jgi:hypothetical protein